MTEKLQLNIFDGCLVCLLAVRLKNLKTTRKSSSSLCTESGYFIQSAQSLQMGCLNGGSEQSKGYQSYVQVTILTCYDLEILECGSSVIKPSKWFCMSAIRRFPSQQRKCPIHIRTLLGNTKNDLNENETDNRIINKT